MTSCNPFREHFYATNKIIFRRCRRSVRVWSGLRTDNGENREDPNGCKFWKTCRWNADDDMAKCNTQANDKATKANNWQTPSASNPGRYNTPPLTRDLVPRSLDRDGREKVWGETRTQEKIKESRALEKKRGMTRMTRIKSSGNQIGYETTPVRTRLETNKTERI